MLALLALLFFIFVALCVWQVERRAWKLALIERVEHRVHAEPVDLPASFGDDEYLHVRASGRFRYDQQVFTQASPAPRWPMYVRQAKQFLKTGIEGFDERKYGFASVVDLFRAAGKEGVVRLERDRHGAVRVFPGAKLIQTPAAVGVEDVPFDVAVEVVTQEGVAAEPVEEPPIVDAETIEQAPAVIPADVAPVRQGARKRKAAAPRTRAAKGGAGGKAEKPRARRTTRSTSEAANKG